MDAIKQPPQAVASEQCVLGAMMVSPDVVWPIKSVLRAEDFYRHDHRAIYAAILSLHDASKTHDFIAVGETLRDTGDLEAAGGLAYLGSLANDIPSVSGAPGHAEIVRSTARRRDIIRACMEASDAAFRTDADEVVSELLPKLDAVNRSDGAARKFHTLLPEARETVDLAAERRTTRGAVGVPTGIPGLDNRLALYGPRLVMVAARPGGGKTAMLNQMAIHAATSGHGGLICSLEMGADELLLRALSSRSRVNFSRLLHGYDADAAFDAGNQMGDIPLWIDTETTDLAAITAQIAMHRARDGIQWAAVDYMHLVEAGRHNSQTDRLMHISRTLKRTAKRAGIPIFALTQLTRDNVKEGRRPELHNLRDAGEQDADVVIALHFPRDDGNAEARKLEIGTLKNRGGKVGWLQEEFQFEGQFQTIRELTSVAQFDDYRSRAAGSDR